MGIVDEDVVRVRESADIVQIVSDHAQLKRVGRRWQGLCPFHTEKSPSFSVNQEQGLYYCFGCGAKGDVITFVREIEHVDFVGRRRAAGGRAGVTLRYTDRNEGEGRKRRAKLIEAMARAVTWYHERLLSAPDAARRVAISAHAASTATRCGPTRSGGRPKDGTSWPGRSSSRTTC